MSAAKFFGGGLGIIGAAGELFGGYGSLLLIAPLTTVIFTHIFNIGGSPLPAIPLILLYVAAPGHARRDHEKVLWTQRQENKRKLVTSLNRLRRRRASAARTGEN